MNSIKSGALSCSAASMSSARPLHEAPVPTYGNQGAGITSLTAAARHRFSLVAHKLKMIKTQGIR